MKTKHSRKVFFKKQVGNVPKKDTPVHISRETQYLPLHPLSPTY